MAVENPPLYVASGSHSAELDRLAHLALVAGQEGVCGTNDLAVGQRGAGANMSVDVFTGGAWVKGDEGTYQGAYYVHNKGTQNVAVAAAHATLARRDIVVARIRDAAYSGGVSTCALEVITGTPSGSPADPTIPASCLPLARLSIAAASTVVLAGNITDLRVRAGNTGSGLSAVTSSTRPASPFVGQLIFETDTQRTRMWNGTVWQHVSGGRVAAQVTRNGVVTSLVGSAVTEFAWTTELEDTDGFHTGSNAFLQVPAGLGGTYAVTAYVAAPGLSGAQLILRRNTFAVYRKAFVAPLDSLTWVGQLNATEYISLGLYNGGATQNDGATNTGDTISVPSPWLTLTKIG